MSEHVTLLQDLDAGKSCSGEAAAAIRDLEKQLSTLRKVAGAVMVDEQIGSIYCNDVGGVNWFDARDAAFHAAGYLPKE